MLRFPAAPAIAAGLLCAPVAAHEQAPAPGTPITLVVWAKRVGQALDTQMARTRGPLGRERPSGVVRIKFNCSDSGRPSDVSVYRSSGNPWMDRAALQAVRQVATLHPLADGMSHRQRYVATLLFANSQDDLDRDMVKIRAEQLKGNAWFKGPAGIALLDPVADAPAG
ncbi:energy transducer TonB family protein [Sphingomonas bacterium]|uniref:energy transducer TonB family protein n=1 Tax=Sphingomonas bacterium TaxID=1895847 RepID=UPI001574F8A9|nr:energy transducer TonB [Sphingomonas bacterium]